MIGKYIAAGFGISGLGLLVWAVRGLIYARASRNWPTASAVVTHAQVSRWLHGRGPRWMWLVRYRFFSPEGREIDSHRVYFGGACGIRVARNIVARFPVGTRIPVYFHPQHPTLCVLLPGANRYTFRAFVIGPIYWLCAAGFWFVP